MTDLSKLTFDSRLNYMKRTISGSTDVTLASAGTAVTHTVTHNLGYVPFFIVGAELNDTSTIWSNNRVHEYTRTSLSGVDGPVQLEYWCDDVDLTIRIVNGGGALAQSGDRTIYWIIYLDYSA